MPFFSGILVLMFLFSCPFGTDQEQKGVSPGRLVLDPEVLDFGKVFDGADPIRFVTLRNRGDGPVTITGVSSTCGCATPRIEFPARKEVLLSTRPKSGPLGIIPAGEEARLYVAFTTHGYKGELRKLVTINTDEGKRGRIHRLQVRAEIVDSIRFIPEILDLGEVVRGERKTGSIRLRSVGIGDFDVKGIRNLPSCLTFSKEKTASGTEAEVALLLGTREDVPMGKLVLDLTVEVQNPRVRHVRFRLKAQVVPKVRFEVEGAPAAGEVDFGVFSRQKGATVRLDMVNRVPAIPYVPLEVTLESVHFASYLEKKLEELEPGVRYRLVLRVKPGVPGRGFLRAKLRIRSDHPDCFQEEFQVIGWITD